MKIIEQHFTSISIYSLCQMIVSHHYLQMQTTSPKINKITRKCNWSPCPEMSAFKKKEVLHQIKNKLEIDKAAEQFGGSQRGTTLMQLFLQFLATILSHPQKLKRTHQIFQTTSNLLSLCVCIWLSDKTCEESISNDSFLSKLFFHFYAIGVII